MTKHCRCRNKTRVIALLDVDSFEVQVRGMALGISPEALQSEPYVVEVNMWQPCMVTSANAAAKTCGIKRGPPTRDQNVMYNCIINILHTPCKYGKPENLTLTKAADDIHNCIASTIKFMTGNRHCTNCELRLSPAKVEKSHMDEFYIDLTDEVHELLESRANLATFLKGSQKVKVALPDLDIYERNLPSSFIKVLDYYKLREMQVNKQLLSLMYGAVIASKVLKIVKQKLGFVISAGLGENKLMSKLACFLGKPNGIGILPLISFDRVQHEISCTKIPGLGGTTGEAILNEWSDLKTIADFRENFEILSLWKWFEDDVDPAVIYDKLHGIDNTVVANKYLRDKITCGKSLNTYPENKTRTKAEFLFHLYNRFHEMRDNLLYEHDRRQGRMPDYLKLEIYRHYKYNVSGKRIVFRGRLPFPEQLMSGFEKVRKRNRRAELESNRKVWKPILGNFKIGINECSTVHLFREDGKWIKKLCRINLIALF